MLLLLVVVVVVNIVAVGLLGLGLGFRQENGRRSVASSGTYRYKIVGTGAVPKTSGPWFLYDY